MEVARESSHLGSRASTTVKARILRYLDEHPRGFLNKQLVDPIGASEAHIRRCCRELAHAGLIYCKNLGMAKEYQTICYFPATLYRTKQSPDVPLPQVHGLSMTVPYDLARQHKHGIGIGSTYKFNYYYKWKWQPGRIISYKYGKNGILDVRLQSTLNPLSFEDFKHFLTGLEFFFKIPTWSQLDKWKIDQYGLAKDIFTMQTNEQITLAGLGNFFSQVYDKKLIDDKQVQRYEYHVSEPIVAKEFMQLFQGGVSAYVQQQFAFATNQLIREQNTQLKGLSKALENLIHTLWRNQDKDPATAAPIIRRPKEQ